VVAPLAASAATAVFNTGVTLQLPANANTSSPSAFFSNISCASVGNCVAVGQYTDTANNQQGLAVAETGGTFATAVEVALPGNAMATARAQTASLNGVSCSSVGNCSAVGNYTDSTGSEQTMAVTIANGTAATAVEASLPANAFATVGQQFAELDAVSCSSVGNCTAVGDYAIAPSNQQAMSLNETSGGWSTAVEVASPASTSTNPTGTLHSISCTSAGNCTAVGNYADTASTLSLMVATQNGGSFGAAALVAPPSAAPSSQRTANFTGVSCPSAGNCTAVGFFTDAAGDFEPLTSTQSSGTFAPSVQLGLPSNAVSIPGDQAATMNGVSCTSPGNCTAVGGYTLDATFDGASMMATETSGTFATPTALVAPANATTVAMSEFSSPAAISCPVSGVCTAAGEYNDTSTPIKTLPLAFTSLAQLALTTSSLPAATTGVSYSSSLATSGGSGNFSYSVSSGSLPAGLSLSSAGVISGTPTAVGASPVTFKVSDNGPPAQSATAALSLAVVAGSAPLPVGISASSVGTPTTGTVVAGLATTLKATDSNGSATLTIPPGALPPGTVVSLYPILVSTTLASELPKGKGYELGFAISWVTPSGTSPPASKPIRLVVLDKTIHRGDSIYQVVPTGLHLNATATHSGMTTIPFSYDPAFVIAATPRAGLVRTVGKIKSPKQVTMMFSCRAGVLCQGTAALTVARNHMVGKHMVVRHVALATAKVSLGAGKNGRVAFRLTPAGVTSFANSGSFTYYRMSVVARIQGAKVAVFPAAVR